MSESVKQCTWTLPPDRAAFARAVTLLVLALAAALLLVNPSGNFPLLDDWSFAAAVRGILEEATFRPTQWTAMTLVVQSLWGSAFALLAGYSFETLRFSTIVLAFASVVLSYWMARELALPRWLCLVISAMLATTPLFLVLSVTFMTDVSFVAATLAAALLLIRTLDHPSLRNLLLATLFSVLAILIRQLAIALPLAFVMVFALRQRGRLRDWPFALAPLLFGIAAFLIYRIWLVNDGRLPSATDGQTAWLLFSLINPATIGIALRNIQVASVYIGWFLLPVLLAIAFMADQRHRRVMAASLFGSAIAIALLTAFTRARGGAWLVQMPTADNIIVRSGIGTPLLRDEYLLRLGNIHPLPDAFWQVVTALGLIGAVLLLALLTTSAIVIASRWRHNAWTLRDSAAALLLVAVAAYLFPLLATSFFDRYLLPTLPLLALALASALLPSAPASARLPPGSVRACSWLLLVAFAVFSVAGTHDFLAWNRLRWDMLAQLMQQRQLTPAQIDGGFEFNGLLNYRENYVRVEGRSNWWVDGDDWMIGFGPVPGYNIVERRQWSRWLPGEGELVILRRLK